MMIEENLKRIRQKIPSHVLLIAVSKGQPVEKIAEALAAGQTHFGENYAQELLAHRSWLVVRGFKPPATSHQPIWHFIGHLQKNKVKQILPTVDLIHSVDSLELAQEIDKRAATLGKIQDILIEINLGNEPGKTGFSVGAPLGAPQLVRAQQAVPLLVQELNQFTHLNLRGFMTIPPAHKDPEASRPYFRQLREIRDEINFKKVYKAPLTELSMGMTNDFEVAIEEGATMVRIGTGIFGDRISPTGVSRVIPMPPLN